MKDSELELTDKFLRDVVINFVLAGRDTTASTLSWLFYNLARTPHAEQKVCIYAHTYMRFCTFAIRHT